MISHLNLLDAMGTMPARFVAELFDAEAFDPSAEGVSFSILIMNALTPLINRFTQPKPFGKVKK